MPWLTDPKKRLGYYDKTSQDQPAELLLEALNFVTKPGSALDIGCGGGVEAKELAKRGFLTTAVDISPEVKKYFSDDSQVKLVIQPIEEFTFEKYDFIFAKNSLVFLTPNKFNLVIEKIKQSLTQNGIFAVRLWGDQDSENQNNKNPSYTFMTLSELKMIFIDFDFLLTREFEDDGPDASGKLKHWHFIDFIVKKRP